MIRNFIINLVILGVVFVSLKHVSAVEPLEQQYTVNVSDVLNISVQGYENLRTVVPVASDGSISFPYVGTIIVKGMTLSEIERELTKRLASGYIKYPVVTVTLSSSRSMKYFVYGEVKNPGKFVLEDDMTVLKAISAAGGITQDGLYGTVKLRRRQKDRNEYKEITLDFINTKNNKIGGDMPIEAEDIIVVGRSKDFFIYGEVAKPGKFVLEDNMTVLRAISLAGGFSKYGSPDKVKILRTVPGKTEYESIKVDIKGAVSGQVGKDIRLEPQDIVVVMEGIL
ncbi:MAG: SLBB domain-containing protein [Candidatus Brocadiaceae bacterium]